jgi:hypothetical protein
MATDDLGLNMQVTVLAIQGRISAAESKRLLKLVVGWIGMSTGGMRPQVWTYPLPGGEGGTGDTAVQPILTAQPLVESIALALAGVGVTDSWAEHDGFYLVVASCRGFWVRRLRWYLRRAGWRVLDADTARVGLKPRKPWLERWFFG